MTTFATAWTRFASLIVLCLVASCGTGSNAEVLEAPAAPSRYATELGRVTVSPGADHVVDTKDGAFRFSLRYSAPEAGLPPGTILQVTPFAHRRPGTAAAKLLGSQGPQPIPVVVEDDYSSRTLDQPGSPVRFQVPLPKAPMQPGDILEFTYDIEDGDVQRAHYTLDGPCAAGFTLQLVSPDGTVLGDLPAPNWAFATAQPRELAVIVPSQAEVGQEVPMVVRVTGSDAPTFSFRGMVEVASQAHVEILPAGRFELTARDKGVRQLQVRFDEPGLYRLVASADGGFHATSNPIRVGQPDQPPIYWGVMHWHTRYSWDARNYQPTCMGAADALRFAREISLLDFLSVSDHGQHGDPDAFSSSDPRMPQVDMSEEDWNAYQDEVLGFGDTADIFTFMGYEHRDPRGDTNVLFRGEGTYFIENGRRRFIQDVWDDATVEEVVTFPQLHLAGRLEDYAQVDPHERLVEIRSWHAAFEYYLNPQPFPSYASVEVKHGAPGERVFVQELLGIGRRLGFVANDDHGDLPANAGVTAVLAPERSQDAIFDTLRARRVYATTGARMVVDFHLGSLQMGQEARVGTTSPLFDRRVLGFEVHGTSAIDTVTIVRNNEPLHVFEVDEVDVKGTFEDTDPLSEILEPRLVGGGRTAYYYLRVVQEDGETAWSSPIFLLE